MKNVRFGSTGLKVWRLCLGTMTFGLQCDENKPGQLQDSLAALSVALSDDVEQRLDEATAEFRLGDAPR